jgi:diguanylate cyclase (GGDEF)-like protein
MWRYHNARYEEPGQGAYVLGHAQDVTEFKLAEARLRNLSLTDELTGLQNPRGFFALATQYLKTARREGQSFAIIYADMDGLKQINDSYGHSAGSQAIKRVSDLLRNSFRASDVIGRMGGDEFAILVTNIAANNTKVPLAHLDEHLRRYNAQTSQPYELSVSVGMICAAGDTDASLEELLAQADQVMYENKKRKRQTLIETREEHGTILIEPLQTPEPQHV